MSETDTTRRRQTSRSSSGIMWLSGFVSLFGLWLLGTAFVETLDLGIATLEFGTPPAAAFWSNVLVGLAILLVAGYNFYRLYTDHDSSVSATGLVLLLGLWTAVLPFLVQTTADAYWSNLLSGVIVAIGAGYATYAGRQRRARATAEA